MEICANLPKIFFDDQVSYYKLRKKKFLVDNRIVFDKPRFLGLEVLTAVFFRCSTIKTDMTTESSTKKQKTLPPEGDTTGVVVEIIVLPLATKAAV